MKDFADELMYRLSEHDVLEKMRIYRIYRDVRFSKDKTPYKKYWGGGIKRASALRRGSYFFSIQPDGKSEVGGGFFGPNKEDMKLIRTQIAQDPTALRRIVKGQKAIELFGGLSGEQVKTAPKGYKKDHPAIDLARCDLRRAVRLHHILRRGCCGSVPCRGGGENHSKADVVWHQRADQPGDPGRRHHADHLLHRHDDNGRAFEAAG